jgi:hypothetical protein
MLDTIALANSGGHITTLDEETLASVVGGEGWKEWVAKQVVTFLVDCVLKGIDTIDTIIEAAEEGYEDAR